MASQVLLTWPSYFLSRKATEDGGWLGRESSRGRVCTKKSRWVQQCSIDYMQYCLEISEFIASIDNMLTVFFLTSLISTLWSWKMFLLCVEQSQMWLKIGLYCVWLYSHRATSQPLISRRVSQLFYSLKYWLKHQNCSHCWISNI